MGKSFSVSVSGSQSYLTLISSFFQFFLLSLAILKHRQYFCMLQTLKLNNKKWKKSLFYEEKSLVGLAPGLSIASFYICLLSTYLRLSICPLVCPSYCPSFHERIFFEVKIFFNKLVEKHVRRPHVAK